MKHTKHNVGMSPRIMAFVLTICIAATSFSPIVLAQAAESTSKPILLCGFAELPNEIKAQSIPLGVSPEKLNLPDTLKATACPTLKDTEPVLPEEPKKQPAPLSIQNVTWRSDPVYSDTAPGAYTFTAVLPQGYALQESAVLPKILVTVMEEALEKTAYEKVVELFLALPGADSITAETTSEEKEAIRARLDKAMAAYDALTDEEKAQFDREHADLFAAALALQSAVISEPLKIMLAPLLPKANANAQVATFAELQAAIANAPTDGTAYVIEVTADFDISTCLTLYAKNITLRGDMPKRQLTRGVANTYLFIVTNGASLTLESIVIDGNKDAYTTYQYPMIAVQKSANLALNKGAVLQNNKATSYSGAVYISDSSTFSMSGAKILNNEGRYGGGIFIYGDFTTSSITISNSVISGNTATAIESGGGLCSFAAKEAFTLNITDGSQITGNTAAGHGGGIYVGKNVTVTMDGASQINGNKSGTGCHGGAIYAADNFTLNMRGASQINNNTSLREGGGIYATTGFTLNMAGASQVNGNVVKENGGGIYSTAGASFSIKEGSQINGNAAAKGGGGIYNSTSIVNFELDNSEICNNKAGGHGGGVCAAANGFPLSVTGSSKINGNEATTGYGGGIAVVSKSFPSGTVVSFEGNSEIVGNTAKNAGAFRLESETNRYTLNIKDSVKIQDNKASADSGAMYVQGADVTLSTKAPISGNINSDKGASALQALNSTLTMNAVCVTKNTGGAALWVQDNSTLTLNSGCTITENTSTSNGGGVYILAGSIIDMKKGSKITKNKALMVGSDRFGGGGIYLSGAGGTIAGEISGNTASDSGGGIYIHGNSKSAQTAGQPKLYIVDGAKIQNNTADYTGGGIYANGPKTAESVDPRAIVYVQGGEITGNTANGADPRGIDSGGGGLAVGRAQAEISGGTITGNTAKVGAGGVQTNGQKVFWFDFPGSGKLTISGGTIKDNISGTATDRTAMGIQALRSANLILDANLANPQSLKVDTSSTLTLHGSSAITTQGNVTIGGNYELITIDPNGGTVTGMVNFISGSNVVLPPASVLAGEVFGGWYDGTTIYQPGDKVAITQTVTYKAIWKYDVTYKAGTGANSGQADKTAIKYSGIDLALLGETYKKAKNIQSGWAISDGGKKAYDLKANYTTDGAIILYPVWSPAGDIDVPVDDYCTITPKSGAGGQITPGKRITVRSGESAGFSMAADKGYQIANVKVDGRSVGVTSQYIFTNIWSDHTIAVSFEKATPTPKPQPDPPIPDKPLRPDPAPDKTPGIITDKDDPGGNPDTQESRPFILLSALLALAAVLLAVLAVLKKCTKKRKLLAILGAVAAVLIFLVTTGWSGIAFANLWTLAVALAAVLPAFVFIAQRKEDEETGEDAPQ